MGFKENIGLKEAIYSVIKKVDSSIFESTFLNKTNLIVGHVLYIKEPYFEGSFRNARFAGYRIWRGVITRQYYEKNRKRHWFYILCLETVNDPTGKIQAGKEYKRMAKNIYTYAKVIAIPINHTERYMEKVLLKFKHGKINLQELEIDFNTFKNEISQELKEKFLGILTNRQV